MPIRRSRAPRKARRAPKRYAKKRGMGGKRRQGGFSPQHAVITESIDYGQFESNTAEMASLQITSFPRALVVAKSFKFYKLKSVEWIYTPDANTFQGGGAEGKPYLYYAMNRTGDASAVTLNGLQAQGSVPISFTKPVNIRYTPNLVQTLNAVAKSGGGGLVDNAIGNTPMYNRWLATKYLVTPSSLDATPTGELPLSQFNHPIYYGHNWIVNQTGGTNTVGYYSVKCVWEFKESQVQTTQTTQSNTV